MNEGKKQRKNAETRGKFMNKADSSMEVKEICEIQVLKFCSNYHHHHSSKTYKNKISKPTTFKCEQA